MKVYMSHPITGVKNFTVTDSTVLALRRLGHEVFYPKEVDVSRLNPAQVVEYDKSIIRNSNLLVIDLITPTRARGLSGVGVGSFMELFYAHSCGVPTIAVSGKSYGHSAWIRAHVSEFCKIQELEVCIERISKYNVYIPDM